MNPHKPHSTSLFTLLRSCWANRGLIMQLSKREIIGRYKGSIVGLGWSFFNPVIMLVVYTFVFSVVFKARWGIEHESKSDFAIVLFIGMIIHGFFAEVMNRCPGLIISNVSYVKKVIFPLQLLTVVTSIAALFHFVVSLSVFFIAFYFIGGTFSWTMLWMPVVFLPLVIMTLGLGLVITSLGVYLRDVGQVIGIVTTILLFLAPIFYPLESLPEGYHFWIRLNPITEIVEQSRNVLIWNTEPSWERLGLYFLIATAILWLGFAWFQKTRKGFADVL